MSQFKVNVKWGKELYKDVELDTSESPIIFKAQLFGLTSVQPERQKIMFKGSVLNDETWGAFEKNLKDGVTLMMMGSVDALPQAPVQQTKFMEDLDESQLAVALDLPVGLKNLGNTCYLNAVVQCFKAVPELCSSLESYKSKRTSSLNDDMSNNLVLSLANTYEFMEKQRMSYPPLLLVQLLRTVFPQFSTTAENGMYQQQDASECWTELLRVLQQRLPKTNTSNTRVSNFIDEYFAGEFQAEMKCDESADEPATQQKESFLQLNCFISPDVKYLNTGLKLRLEERLTKQSPTLGRDASYTKISRISRLPGYLCVQYVRFFYKEKDKVNAKILKDVKFQMTLDVFELCTSELQQRLLPMREKFRLVDTRLADEVKQTKKQQNDPQAPVNIRSVVSTVSKTETKKAVQYEAYSFDNDSGSNNSGLYELIAVLTHKGRSSNSGHYVGWAKNSKTNEWLMFDDDNVCRVEEEDILRLSGGGDHHTCYILLYGPRKLDLNYYNETINGSSSVAQPTASTEQPMQQ